ncbi:hypothetical protein GBA52_008126 [Prunus armeniaca]|nr:hypothetical protein GBA52_008126 [Prunus armeniaca]
MTPKTYGYFMIGWTNASDFVIGCSVEWTTAMLDLYNNLHQHQNASYEYVHNALLYGFDLGYSSGHYICKGWDRFNHCLPYTFSSFFQYMALRFHAYKYRRQ